MVGLPPITANMSNMGLIPATSPELSGYRAEMVGAAKDLRRIVPAAFIGGLIGALLVLVPTALVPVVPVLIGFGILLVLFGKRLGAWASTRHAAHSPRRLRDAAGQRRRGWVYGGYFGGAQGVILMGVFTALTDHPLQRLNGYKNVCATTANLVAAVVFVVFAGDRVDWGGG